jgi:hypothetical protein
MFEKLRVVGEKQGHIGEPGAEILHSAVYFTQETKSLFPTDP